MIRYSLTIFLSAFLLFQIQPMIARLILPWFGGTAAVWTTCMMFFQIALLAGYCYAHLLRRWCPPKLALPIHAALLLTAMLLGTVEPPDGLRPAGDANPTWAIVLVLSLSVGLPFVALATTGPLIQAWQSQTHPQRSAYRLYGLSNLGSMLALLSYPFVFERFWPLEWQVWTWRIGFGVFAVCCFWSQRQTLTAINRNQLSADVLEPAPPSTPSWQPLTWIILAMAASVVLLATTNLMCQEVASVPFLWILPLSLYLLSFIICFDRPTLYRRAVFTPLLIASVIAAIALVHLSVFAGLGLQIAGLATVCFAASMTCHGELERLKPPAERLTLFYLCVSIGGALGGVFVTVVATRLFAGFYEFHCGLLVALFVALTVAIQTSMQDRATKSQTPQSKLGPYAAAIGVFAAIGFVGCSLAYYLDPSYHQDVVFRARNEYGLVSVIDQESLQYRRFINGRIEHGGQSLDAKRAQEHAGYYVEGSGVAVAFESLRGVRAQSAKEPEPHLGTKTPQSLQAATGLNVGVVGLGAGAMATWLEPRDRCVFYEINPLVETIAREHFSFLSNCGDRCEVVLGDGRMRLEDRIRDEHSGRSSNRFDLLFMDAFASDSIPVHLLTHECFEVYLANLAPDGILVAHITNRFVDLLPVLAQHAVDFDLTPLLVEHRSDDGKFETRWVLLTRNEAVISSDAVAAARKKWPPQLEPLRWTDDRASLAAVVNWSAGIDWEKIQLQLQVESNKGE